MFSNTLKNLSASFQHATCPRRKQIATGRVSFYSTGCIYSVLLSSSHYNPHYSMTCDFLCCFPHRFKLQTLPCANLLHEYKQTERNLKLICIPKIQPRPFHVVPRQELLCLKQPLFVCYFSMWLGAVVHYYLCT